MRRARLFLLGLAICSATSLACTTMQQAAAQDPMKCERDPACTAHQEKSKDCITTCVDDPACVERCREVTGQR